VGEQDRAGWPKEQPGISPDDLQSTTRTARVMTGRIVLSVVSKAYGYQGKEMTTIFARTRQRSPDICGMPLRNGNWQQWWRQH